MNGFGHILVVDRDRKWCDLIIGALGNRYSIKCVQPNGELWNQLKTRSFNVIVFDIENESDLDIFLRMHDNYSLTPVIVTTTPSEKTPSLLVKVIKEGAHDFVEKPYSAARIALSIKNALSFREMQDEIDYLRREQDVIYDFDKIIAYSPVMINTISTLKKFANVDSTLLLTGETGTGKSFLAGAVHFSSPRKARPFIKVNCANIPDQLLESELFGHEKGAFTGAVKTRIGRIEQARGGTVFLDEIGEMSVGLQTKLLRFIEEKQFERLGSNTTITVDVRIIAATNKDFPEMVRKGQFREDLYYRLSVLHVHVPPLRERKECIIPLAYYFLGKKCRVMNKKIVDFSPEALKKLQDYSWPGNVRQLSNTIERAVIVEEGPVIKESSILLSEIDTRCMTSVRPKKVSTDDESEKKLILETLDRHGWVQKKAAEALGISPRVLNYKIKKYAISHPLWRKHK